MTNKEYDILFLENQSSFLRTCHYFTKNGNDAYDLLITAYMELRDALPNRRIEIISFVPYFNAVCRYIFYRKYVEKKKTISISDFSFSSKSNYKEYHPEEYYERKIEQNENSIRRFAVKHEQKERAKLQKHEQKERAKLQKKSKPILRELIGLYLNEEKRITSQQLLLIRRNYYLTKKNNAFLESKSLKIGDTAYCRIAEINIKGDGLEYKIVKGKILSVNANHPIVLCLSINGAIVQLNSKQVQKNIPATWYEVKNKDTAPNWHKSRMEYKKIRRLRIKQGKQTYKPFS